MLSFLNIFCCCSGGSSKNPQQDEVDETTRLIPEIVAEQPPSSPALVYVDHERLRERLGTIVRAKEGKMVNVIQKSHLRSRTHFDTLGPAAGRTASTLPPQKTPPMGLGEHNSFVQAVGLDVDHGLPRGKSPTPSAKAIFVSQEDVQLSLSWEE
ncbi:hypothetical protein E1B28_011585 [Marasmius oreades]|uniref:Uncharacterized protein n=1 Tax=Marasmius oreades TaxID=181124 RepID=A0A9P7UQD8_9AGAR|nr:uncharacterized protein E1B28_011585 [Marasmius oreades]KAG7089960.1 hypothetical protein E1B28_011585 [Marasmius oreades]